MDIAVLWEKKLLQNVSVRNQKFSAEPVDETNEQACWSVYTMDEYKGQQDEMKLRRFLVRR
jgi:hypothetical protein